MFPDSGLRGTFLVSKEFQEHVSATFGCLDKDLLSWDRLAQRKNAYIRLHHKLSLREPRSIQRPGFFHAVAIIMRDFDSSKYSGFDTCATYRKQALSERDT